MNGPILRLTLMSGRSNIQKNPKKMKKFSLEMLRLTSDEVLGRSQMKKITGGYSTTLRCSDWSRTMQVHRCNQSTINFYCREGGSCT